MATSPSHLASQEALDWANVHDPKVQACLRRLSIAPKPKQWSHDKALKKQVRDHVKIHAELIADVKTFFESLIQHFWLRAQQKQNHELSLAARIRSRAFTAMCHQNANIEKILRQKMQKEIEALQNQKKKYFTTLEACQQVLIEIRLDTLGSMISDVLGLLKGEGLLGQIYSHEGLKEDALMAVSEKMIHKVQKHPERSWTDNLKRATQKICKPEIAQTICVRIQSHENEIESLLCCQFEGRWQCVRDLDKTLASHEALTHWMEKELASVRPTHDWGKAVIKAQEEEGVRPSLRQG